MGREAEAEEESSAAVESSRRQGMCMAKGLFIF
jgi:hypothetical protein